MYSFTARSTIILYSVHVVNWIIKYVQLSNQIHSSPVHCTVYMELVGLFCIYSRTTRSTAALYSAHVIIYINIHVNTNSALYCVVNIIKCFIDTLQSRNTI